MSDQPFNQKKYQTLLAASQQPVAPTRANLLRLLSIIDLTLLDVDASDQAILALCARGKTALGDVAAICVYPAFAAVASTADLPVATVANFPTGDETLEQTCEEIARGLSGGAAEIDVVFPYRDYLAGDIKKVTHFLTGVRKACSGALLKVILETGVLLSPAVIYRAGVLAIDCGADFLKTSTGKTAQGASFEAAAAMLLAIENNQRIIGFKASGGVRDNACALGYLQMADAAFGRAVTKREFRIGASQLLNEVTCAIV
jgi:deoxyribose-phosphate aldolase